MLFTRNRVRHILNRLSTEHRVYIGTASWRFPGWCGTLYDEDRYLWGKHFSKKRFREKCIEEYAAVFSTVEVDSTYYSLPKMHVIEALASQVPDNFLFSFKVPDTITIKNYPDMPKFGKKAGQPNEHFLDVSLFKMGFLRHMEAIRGNVGVMFFEFSHFRKSDFDHGRDFAEKLDVFLGSLPEGWRYGVEIRNRNLLHPDYFSILKHHGVAHVYNQWTSMPSVSEQMELHPLTDNPFVAGRFLLTPGCRFETARKQFEPFNRIQEVDPEARKAMVDLALEALETPENPPEVFIYTGNDLEGNALHTISDVLEVLEEYL